MGNVARPHELAVFSVMAQEHPAWTTADTIAEQAGVAPRTARQYVRRFAELGVVDRVEAFPANRYRLIDNAAEHAYVAQLRVAADVLGIAFPVLP